MWGVGRRTEMILVDWVEFHLSCEENRRLQ